MTEGERIAAALERIAAVLEVLVSGAMSEPVEEPDGCPHPPDSRVSFGTTAGVADWQCGVCGFRTLGDGDAHG